MKKVISIILLLTLCLGLFAGCDTTPAETTSDLANAKAIVFNAYKPANKDEVPAKSSDFEVMTSVLVKGVSYPVEWTLEVTTGAADAVKLVEGSTGYKKVDVTEKPEADIFFTMTAVISDKDGKTETVSFNFMTPAFKAPTADKIVIQNVADKQYTTGTEYEYTSSSGSTKMELVLSKEKAEAIAFTLINNDDGTVSFKTNDGKYLFCDGNSVEFAAEAGEYTKFYLEAADGGYFIKSNGFYQNNPEKPQYLEVYNGYLTCYGMNASKADIYTFTLEDATGANGTVVEFTPSEGGNEGEGGGNEGGDTTGAPEAVATPEIGKAYKMGLFSTEKNAAYYFTGVMSGYYGATSTTMADGVDVYVEDAGNGAYYITFTVDGAKKYVGTKVSGTHLNFVIVDEADRATFTWNADNKTFYTMMDGKETFMGTDTKYVTFGMKTTDVVANSYPAHLYIPTEGEGGDTAGTPEAVATPEIGKAYKMGLFSTEKNAAYYFTGVMSGYYGATSTTMADGVDVYVEDAGNGAYYITFTVDGAKKYVGTKVSGTHLNFVIVDEADRATFTWNADNKTFYTMMDGKETFMGTSGKYVTFGMMTSDKVAESYAAHLYVATEGEGGEEGGETPNAPTGPNANGLVDVTELKTDTEYYIESITNNDQSLYFDGTEKGGRINGTFDLTKAVAVKLEAGEAAGEYYIYFEVNGTKTYLALNKDASSKTAAFVLKTEKDASCVWLIDAAAKTIASKDFANRSIATKVAETKYTNFSSYSTQNLADSAYSFAWLMEKAA